MNKKLPINVKNLKGQILGEPGEHPQMIPPTPHYPFWRYLCPLCRKFWEQREKLQDFRQYCEVCQTKVIQGQHCG
tara:strand:+ start:2754 stop:2978 length:225 start_codon:yes stop_codon:yes gene_type:complete